MSTEAAPKVPTDPEALENLRDEMIQAIEEGRKITDEAIKAERELTDEERRKVDALMSKTRRMEVRLKNAQAGQHLQNFTYLSDGLKDLLGGTLPHTPSGMGKAVRGGDWGAAVVRESSDQFGRWKGLTPSGSVLVDIPAPEPVALGRPVISLRQVIPTQQSNGAYAFLRQTLRDSNAAVVAPGALKPTSVYEFERVEERCRTIAHLSEPLHRADLADAPDLTAFVQAEMTWGLQMALEAEILTGDGTGEHLTGLAHTAGVQTVPLTGATEYDRILTLRRGLTRLETYNLTGSAYVMNPADYEAVEMTSTDDGGLLLQGADQAVPIDSAARRLFGVPVISSPSCPVDVAWLINSGSVRLWEREGVRLDWSENVYRPDALGAGIGASDFETNRVTWRAEGRWGFGVTRPTGVVRIALA